jgi:hypothetical protein
MPQYSLSLPRFLEVGSIGITYTRVYDFGLHGQFTTGYMVSWYTDSSGGFHIGLAKETEIGVGAGAWGSFRGSSI